MKISSVGDGAVNRLRDAHRQYFLMGHFGNSYQELLIDPAVCTLGLIYRGCLLYKQHCETM